MRHTTFVVPGVLQCGGKRRSYSDEGPASSSAVFRSQSEKQRYQERGPTAWRREDAALHSGCHEERVAFCPACGRTRLMIISCFPVMALSFPPPQYVLISV